MISGHFFGQIDVDDLGLWRGWAVFDAMMARGKTIFHFEDHYHRLIKSCELSGISLPILFSFDVLQKQLAISLGAEIEKSKTRDFLIKVMITQGNSSDHKTQQIGKSNWYYRILPLLIPKSEPLKLVLKKAIKSNFPEIKSTGSYHDAMVFKKKVQEKGFDDFLYFHKDTGITESATANIFFVYNFHGNNILATPADNILFGVTRSIVLSLARNHDIFYAVLEMPSHLFGKNFLKGAEECFLTSTSIGIKEVASITDCDGTLYNFNIQKSNLTNSLKQKFLLYREEYFKRHPA